MKQLLQNMRDGKAEVTEVPIPTIKPGHVLVKNIASVVSAGTERMVVEFAEKSLVGKAQSRPDLVRQVLDKAKREGVIPTIQAAFNRLDKPMALGYSTAGIVVEVGDGVVGFHPGMHVACAGGGFAAHAEYGLIPKNLLVPVPEEVPFEEAAFATLGAISLQGFRLAAPQVGEKVAIIGLGLLGLLMVGIAKAAGCQVFGIDLDPARIKLAEEMGIDKAVSRNQAEGAGSVFSKASGFDSVFICADTKSNDPIELAGELVRDKGVVVAVGAVGMQVPRNIYYHKEAAFLISRSYGPGRYDNRYEEQGFDYPYGYVRWTEGRNLEAIVNLIANKKLFIEKMITHRFSITDGVKAYETITGKNAEPFLGVVLKYPYEGLEKSGKTFVAVDQSRAYPGAEHIKIGVLGAGNYATAMFLPVIEKVGGVDKIAISSARGLNARHAAAKFNFKFAGTSEDEIINHEEINTVVLLTRHADHKRQVVQSLSNKKHVYCEKPLALNFDELKEIEENLFETQSLLMVGFNRRFAPLSLKLKEFLNRSQEPKHIHYRVNAGFLPDNHWLHDLLEGGGRIIGEGCHFIDYLTFLTGSLIQSVTAFGLPDQGKYHEDNVTIVLRFEDGSVGTVDYLANGDKSVSKETVEVFSGGQVAFLNDFRELKLVSNGKHQKIKARSGQDKGHAGAWSAFVNAVKNGNEPPIPYNEIFSVTKASFAAVQSLRENKTINL